MKFTKEFYHPNNDKYNKTPILLMMPKEPSDEMQELLKSPFFNGKIFYLLGNPLLAADLNLAKITDNKIIIMNN